jgi:hypothetical protein
VLNKLETDLPSLLSKSPKRKLLAEGKFLKSCPPRQQEERFNAT